MDRSDRLTVAFAAGRIAFGVALLALPARVGSAWLGPAGEQPAVHVALRGLGARDIGLAAGSAWAATRGGAVKPWLASTVAGDLVDLAATLAAGDAVPARARRGTIALAGGSALAGAALAVAVDR
jgi:hypothetical protein